MNPFMSQTCLQCHTTILYMFDGISQSYIFFTNIFDLFSKPYLQQSLTLCPFEYIFFMCDPPSGGFSFHSKVPCGQVLLFYEFSSISIRKDASLGKYSYVGRSLTLIPTCCIDRLILAHFLMDTLCILLCQFSNTLLEYDVQELILHQLSFPLAVVFM